MRDAGRARSYLVDIALFRIRPSGGATLWPPLVSLGEFGLLFTLPLFLQSVIGYDALQTGVILLALPLVRSSPAGGPAGRAAGRAGPHRPHGDGARGARRPTHLSRDLDVGDRLGAGPGLFVYGLGVGFATAQLTGVILSEVPVSESGQASAVQSTSRQMGAAIGTALLGATLIAGLGSSDRGTHGSRCARTGG